MIKIKKTRFIPLLLILLLVGMMAAPAMTMAASPGPVGLGTAVNYAVLGGLAISNTGATVISGDVGLYPNTLTSVTGFPPGTVLGTTHANDATALQAQTDLTTAYTYVAGLAATGPTISGDIGGLTFTPGVYNSTSTLGITNTLTLDAQGDPNAVFIFQMGSALTTAAATSGTVPGSTVALINGAQAYNVFWQVGTDATLGTYSIFKGTILAHRSITANTGADVVGRLLSMGGNGIGGAAGGAVALDSTISVPTLAPTYTVTFNSHGGSLVAPITGIASGATVTLPAAPTQAGFTFNGWFTAATGGTAFTAFTGVTANITVHAQWTAVPPTTYTVTFDSQGGSLVAPIAGIASGATVTLPAAPTQAGFTFNGWFTAATGGTAFTAFTAVTANITVYAQWTAVPPTTYTVTFDSQGGSLVAPIAGIASGATVTLPAAPTQAGFTFNGWFTAATGGTAFTAFTAVTANITVYAQWTPTGGGGGGGGGGTVSSTPTVQTEVAMVVSVDSVVMNGDIASDNGANITDYGFLWGTSASSLTNKLDVGTDNHSGAFTATLSSLTVGTKYYFQAYATNSQGTAKGSVLTFTTTENPQIIPVTTPTILTLPGLADVSASYWGDAAISSLTSKGIVSGYPDGSFKPDASITRAEFATMLVKALGLSTSGTTDKFTDVTKDSWYYGFVNDAASLSLISGMGDNLFTPNALITREQMAVMVTNALGDKTPVTDGTELNAFSDKSAVSSWAISGMAKAVKAGILSGITADTLAPQADATRAQAAVMIYKMLTVLGK